MLFTWQQRMPRRSCSPATRSENSDSGSLTAKCECTNLPRVLIARGEWALSINRTSEHKSKREELAKLKRAALAELERRGYEVRGKTPAQIREMLKRRPKKSARAK